MCHGGEHASGSAMTASYTMLAAAISSEGNSGNNSDHMDIDTAVGTSSVGKCKHSDASLHDNNIHDNNSPHANTVPVSASISTSHNLPASSAPPSSLPTPSISPNPPKKKTISTHKAGKASLASAVTATTSSNIAIKITPAVAIHGMQKTLNCLTNVMERNLGPAPYLAATQRTKALTLLQQQDNHLTIEQKSAMIHQFTSDATIAEVYLVLNNDKLRRAWLGDLLKD